MYERFFSSFVRIQDQFPSVFLTRHQIWYKLWWLPFPTMAVSLGEGLTSTLANGPYFGVLQAETKFHHSFLPCVDYLCTYPLSWSEFFQSQLRSCCSSILLSFVVRLCHHTCLLVKNLISIWPRVDIMHQHSHHLPFFLTPPWPSAMRPSATHVENCSCILLSVYS